MYPERIERPLVFVALVVLGVVIIAGGSGMVSAVAHHEASAPALHDDGVKAIPGYIKDGLDWLASAQFQSGGWGAGQHSAQNIRDPHAVQIDPATTAFAAMALMRSGSSIDSGPYAKNVRLALEHLLKIVEESSLNGSQITGISGTQPQVKLGHNIDVSMTAQFFARVLPTIRKGDRLKMRVERALDKCLRKLESAQQSDGSWNEAGWAPVLQSAVANGALEMAAAAGREVDREALERSREYQKGNVDAVSGEVRTDAAAGISLYSIASSQRASAPAARDAIERINEAKRRGELDEDADVSVANLQKVGFGQAKAEELFDSYRQNQATKRLLSDDRVLSGFGNNGGEEFLSYMMTSESLVVTGDNEWDNWHARMNQLFARVQNPDGSWSGHHCITSPVFCTAAVILTMTADRDAQFVRNRDRG
jgi:hypothetical protein